MSSIESIIKRIKSGSVALLFLMTQLTATAVPLITNSKVYAGSNNGTLKVHELGTPSNSESNDPKVCVFNFEAFDLDPNQTGDITIEAKSPTDPIVPLVIPLSTDSSGNGSTSPYVNDIGSPYVLDDGHYEATLDNKFGTDPGSKAKSKVFKVKCDENGEIEIIKNAVPNDEQDFYFSSDVEGMESFMLDDDGDETNELKKSKIFEVPGGTYTFTENITEGWYLEDITCTRNSDNEQDILNRTVSITIVDGESVTCTFENRPETQTDYCDPTQRPNGMSIARWLAAAQFNGADCFEVELDQQCGYFNVEVTKYPTADGWGPYVAAYTTDGTVIYPANSFPATFTEDENGGSVDVTWYLIGPEGDYLEGFDLPNYWDGVGSTVSVNTDCEDEPIDINVTKFNDINRNGYWDVDDGEEALPNWDINLSANDFCDISFEIIRTLEFYCPVNEYNETQPTGQNGMTVFEDVDQYYSYILSEVEPIKEGWSWSNTYCEVNGDRLVNYGEIDNRFLIDNIGNAESVDCFIGNYNEPVLNLEKSNDSPNADNGDIVTYTLQVNVPDDSGASFDTCVTDLIPEGFDYNGVWTASSSSLGHNVSNEVANSSEDCGSAGGPDYSSPGQWFIGTVLPGETVTLTYQAVIGDEVFPGIYPDVAYATGDACGPEAINCSEGGEDIYSNLHNTGDDPFVSTTVAIDGPQILGASTVTRLANTGDAYMHWYATFAAILLAAGLLIAKRFNISKGGLK